VHVFSSKIRRVLSSLMIQSVRSSGQLWVRPVIQSERSPKARPGEKNTSNTECIPNSYTHPDHLLKTTSRIAVHETSANPGQGPWSNLNRALRLSQERETRQTQGASETRNTLSPLNWITASSRWSPGLRGPNREQEGFRAWTHATRITDQNTGATFYYWD
jgi:hypothetical protein